eukprot:Awhi_evm1s12723
MNSFVTNFQGNSVGLSWEKGMIASITHKTSPTSKGFSIQLTSYNEAGGKSLFTGRVVGKYGTGVSSSWNVDIGGRDGEDGSTGATGYTGYA